MSTKTTATANGINFEIAATFQRTVEQSEVWGTSKESKETLYSNHYRIRVKTQYGSTIFDFYGSHQDWKNGKNLEGLPEAGSQGRQDFGGNRPTRYN